MSPARDDGGSEVVRLPQRTPFTMVDNPIIRAMTDYCALGLYLDMLSYPAGWRINIRELARTHKQGRQVLTDAMNDLIEKGLVFRVRFQEGNGQWRTRTYVCSSPVTPAELNEVREQYAGRCVIESTPTSTIASPPDTPEASVDNPAGTEADTDTAQNDGTSPLVTPSTRFPAPGEPASGRPTLGNRVPQRSEVRRKKPPPTSAGRSSQPTSGQRRQTEEEVNHGYTRNRAPTDAAAPEPLTAVPPPDAPEPQGTSQVTVAMVQAWPGLGRRDVDRLRPLIVQALTELPVSELTAHLTGNTGGALHPASVLRSRLENLPAAPPRRARLPAWCGRCAAETYRWIQDEDGRPVRPCPDCSPQARSHAHKSNNEHERSAS